MNDIIKALQDKDDKKAMENVKIKPISRKNMETALPLVWEVFSKYEAVDVYKKFGFVVTGEIQEDEGIKYVPMEYRAALK